MERDQVRSSVGEYFEANYGRNILSVRQKVFTPEFKFTAYTQNLIVGKPEDVKLSKNIFSTFDIWNFSGGEIRNHHFGQRLENSILHLAKTGQIVLIFDTDDLNFPYLAYLNSLGLIKTPFNFTQLDAHFDINDLEAKPPKKKDLDSIFKFQQKGVGVANFLTAMAATGYLKKLVHVNPAILMTMGGEPPEVYSNIKRYGVEFEYISPYFKFFNRFPRLLKGKEPTVLAFDVDFFGSDLTRNKRTASEKTDLYLGLIKKNGYTPEKCPVICIATSPGFNEGFRDDEEKLEIVNQIIDRLTLH